MRHLLPLLLLLPGLALGYPVTEKGTFEGGSATSALTVSTTGRYVITAQRSSSGLAIWDRLAPREEPLLVEVCEAVDAAYTIDPSRGRAVYVACGTNEVVRVAMSDTDGDLEVSVGDPITVGLESESVVAIEWAENDDMVHVVTSGSSLVTLHTIDTVDDAVDQYTGLPLQLTGTPVDLAVAPDGGPVLIPRSAGSWVYVNRSTGVYSGGENLGITGTAGTIAVDPAGLSDDFIISYPNDSELWVGTLTSPATVPTLFSDEVSSPQAVAFIEESTLPVLFVANASGTVRVLDETGTTIDSVELSSTGSPVAISPDPTDAGTVFVAGGDGNVQVITDNPWVTALSASTDTLSEGGEVTITFSVDEDVDWDLRVDSAYSATSGTSLAMGTAAADEEVDVVVSADDLTNEGANRIVLFAEGSSGTSRDSVEVTLDTPPDGISGVAVSPGDGRLELVWTSSDEEDIDHFLVYVSDAVFDADSLPTLEVEDEDGETIEYPIEVEAGEPSSSHSTSLLGLTNGTTYWVAVRPVDAGGLEGPVSSVVSAAPELTCGLVECTGDPGCTCSSAAPLRAPGILALLALGLGLGPLLRRRR